VVIIVSEVFAWVWPAGRLNQARGSVTLASDTTKTETLAVPAGKIWLCLLKVATRSTLYGLPVALAAVEPPIIA